MSNLQTLPKGDSAWLFRKAIQRIIQQISVLETNIGSSTTGNSANTQIIFNDNGVLRGDAGLTYNATTDLLTVVSATITGDLTAARLIVTGGTIPTNGLWLPTTNTLEFAANSLAQYRIAPLGVFSWYDGAGGTRMTLNSTGLGIGIAPELKLRVDGPDAAPATSGSSTTNGAFRIGAQGASTNLCVDAGVSTTGGIYGWFQSRARNNYANNYDLVLQPNGGNVGVGVTPAGTGGCLQLKSGITFPATQVASSDANTLDDYEEGTWTPALTFATPGTLALTYNTQSGSYTKIGRLVTVIFRVSFAAAGIIKGTASGNLSITGLPFTVGSPIAYQYVDLGSSITDITTGSFALITATGTSISFETVSTSGTRIQRDSAGLTAASFAASNAGFITISGTFTYFV
jgi:hypothetical protein